MLIKLFTIRNLENSDNSISLCFWLMIYVVWGHTKSTNLAGDVWLSKWSNSCKPDPSVKIMDLRD